MQTFESQIRELFRREVTDKLKSPAFAFGAFALYTLFTKLGCARFALPVEVASVCILVCSYFRVRLHYEFQKMKMVADRAYHFLRWLVWVNGFCYGIIFSLAAYEHSFSGTYNITIVGLICGFVSASMITVSGDLSMFLPFTGFLLLPQIALLGYDFAHDDRYQGGGLLLLYNIYLFYQLKSVFELRARLRQAFVDQLQVIASAEEIQRSHEIRLEQELKLVHTSRLASLGEMASGIAHEVNNPLTVVSVSLEMLKRKLSSVDEVQRAGFTPYIDKSLLAIQRIGKITNGLKHLSRQSDHKPKQETFVRSIVDDTISFCGEILRTRMVNLRINEVPEDLKVLCHPIQISQVLVNLIKNAEDAVETCPNEERWVEVDVKATESQITLRVSNGGPCIPEEVRASLFKPYFTTKDEGKGTGLGLSISREIAREHEGDLTLLSDVSNTAFEMRLPRIQGSHSNTIN